ncbi:hypothetical protein NL676_017577 [Syzygium grande]|nr:hypothetical protein NL676_017577 [Syzygium grande]
MTTKVTCMITLMVDVYDIFGTWEELQLLTTFIERWDISETDKLPTTIRTCFLAMYNTTNEIGCWTVKERGKLSKETPEYICSIPNVMCCSSLILGSRTICAPHRKQMNKDALGHNPCSGSGHFLGACLNLARALQLFYQHGDGHGILDRETKDSLSAAQHKHSPYKKHRNETDLVAGSGEISHRPPSTASPKGRNQPTTSGVDPARRPELRAGRRVQHKGIRARPARGIPARLPLSISLRLSLALSSAAAADAAPLGRSARSGAPRPPRFLGLGRRGLEPERDRRRRIVAA